MQKLQKEKNVCSQCGSSNVVTDRSTGEVICTQCGLVISDRTFDRSAEWIAHTLAEHRTKSRAGAPTKYAFFNKGLQTTIKGYKDATGKTLSTKARRKAWRLRKWHNRTLTHDSRNRNLIQAMNELQMLSEKLHISESIKEVAAVIYRKALNEGLTRGRSIANIVAAALYAACRFTRTPKTLKDIAKVSSRRKEEISKSYRLLVQTLKMEMPSQNPLRYVSRIAEKAKISGNLQGVAAGILRKAKSKRITLGKDPAGIAAAALYLASQIEGEKVTQKEIALAAGMTEVTVRNRKKELVKKLKWDFNDKSNFDFL